MSIDPILSTNVRNAMKKTIESKNDVSKSYEVCELWDIIPFEMLPNRARATAFALYAACLVRVGRDSKAIDMYDSCLALKNLLERNTLEDVIMGRASALQRRMSYKEAANQYLESSSSKGTLGAITCSLRLQNLEGAIEILDKRAHPNDIEITATASLLRILQCGSIEQNDMVDLKDASKTLPLFHWIYCTLKCPANVELFKFDIMDIASINQNSYDDPLLIHLDDKLSLHELLHEKKDSFWPVGFILPKEREKFIKYLTDNESMESWIMKSASGYGSHGNMIATGEEVLSLLEIPQMEPCLCQLLINPSLLLDQRKFSMRVYVYYFLNKDIYISSLGLVKLASQVYKDHVDDDRMHMTNSGREENMLQYNFVSLRNHFQKVGWSYDDFWELLEQAVYTTMQCYEKQIEGEKQESYRGQLRKFCIPKILGFDFTVTEDRQPMLLEVNRYPGLEPRGVSDTEVKNSVVRDAWICAAEQCGISSLLGGVSPSKTCSYKKIKDKL